MAEQVRRLTSWKEIAAYLKSSVRTCQKYEAKMGLPVHRLDGSPKAHVFAYPADLDGWLVEMGNERVQPAPAPSSPIRSVAVMPFVDLGIEEGSAPLASGIPEAIINVLCRIPDLHVPGLGSTSSARDRRLNLLEIGQALDVAHVLEGSVQITGERLRVTAQLSCIADGAQLWEDKYDRKTGGVLDIQDEISMAIVDKLTVALLSKERAMLRKRPTSDAEAYALYLKGRFFMARTGREANQKALTTFEAALDRDPAFALAYAGVALVYVQLANQSLMPASEAYPKVASAVRRALVLDPNLAEAHALGAARQLLYEWDMPAAEKGFLRALELKPGDSMIRGYYAWTLLAQRRFEEARVEIKRALAADPLMPWNYYRAVEILRSCGYCEEALEVFLRCREIDPDFGLAYFAAGRLYRRLGRIDEAMEAVEKARRLTNSPGLFDGDLAACCVLKGDRPRAERLLAGMLEVRKTLPLSALSIAGAHFVLGDLDGGYNWLETAIRERAWEVLFIRFLADDYMPDLAATPRFQAVCDRLGLPR